MLSKSLWIKLASFLTVQPSNAVSSANFFFRHDGSMSMMMSMVTIILSRQPPCRGLPWFPFPWFHQQLTVSWNHLIPNEFWTEKPFQSDSILTKSYPVNSSNYSRKNSKNFHRLKVSISSISSRMKIAMKMNQLWNLQELHWFTVAWRKEDFPPNIIDNIVNNNS